MSCGFRSGGRTLIMNTILILGQKNFLNKAIDLFERENEIDLKIQGWRKKYLMKYILELLYLTTKPEDQINQARLIRYLIRSFWLWKIGVLYGLALEKKMAIKLISSSDKDNAAVIRFRKKNGGQ